MDDIEAFGQFREQALPASPAEASAPPRVRRSHWLRNAVLLIAGYFVLAAATTVQPLTLPLVDTRLALPFPGGAPMLFGLPDRPFTVMVVGVDRRPTEAGPTRTDTILLVRIDPDKHDAAFLSIPRDALMEIPLGDGAVQRDRINTAFVYNYDAEDGGAAPEALAATIEHNFGIHVDHYVVFDHYNSRKLIDALGGVTIDNPREFGQENYSEDDVHVVPQHFPAGKISLDGYEAVAYGRIREGSTDFDRMERQQRVASAMVDRASSPASLLRIPSLVSAFRASIDSDMSLRQSAGVLAMLKRVPDGHIAMRSLAEAAVSCASCADSIQLLDAARAAEIIAEAFGDVEAGRVAAERLAAAGVTP
jgi:LCP family protein required for cell wall assembly